MKEMNLNQLTQISGGLCSEHYEATVPLTYLSIVAKHVKKLNLHQFDPDKMIEELVAAGLDPRESEFTIRVFCTKTVD